MIKSDKHPDKTNSDKSQNFKILVVEDDDGLNRLIQKRLQKEGYETDGAITGKEALAKTNGDINEILLIDYKLPDMTGKQLTKKLTQKYHKIPPIIVITGFGDEKVAVEMMKLGVCDYIVKEPDFIDILPEKIKHICAEIDKNKKLEKAEEDLRKSLEVLNDTGEMARVGGWEVNLEDNTVYWTKSTKKIHEVPEDYLPTLEEAINFFPGESKTRMEKAIDKAIQEGSQYEIESQFVTAKGNTLWVHAIGKPELKEGNCVRLRGTFQDITERKKAEEKLQSNQATLKRTQKIARVGSWDWNIATDTVTWSEELFRIFKLDREKGAPSYADHPKIYTPESMQRLDTVVRHTLETGEPYEIDLEIIRGDGTNAFCTARGLAKKDEKGKVIQLFGSFQDITERIKAEEKLKALNRQLQANEHELQASNQQLSASEQQLLSGNQQLKANEQQLRAAVQQLEANEQQLRAANQQLQAGEQQLRAANQQLEASEKQLRAANQQLQASEDQLKAANQRLLANEKELVKSKETAELYLNISSEIIMIFDYKGKITLLNESGHHMLGYDNNELIGKNWFETCIPRTISKKLRKEFQKFMNGEAEEMAYYQNQVITKSGELKNIRWYNHTLKNDDGKIIGLLSSGEDITKRIKAEDELKKSEKFSRSIISSLPDGFSILDAKGVHLDVNKSFCEMTGFSKKELVGTKPPHPYWPEEEYENINRAFEKSVQGKAGELELVFKKKNDERFPVIVSPSQLMDGKGNVISNFATIKDITEWKKVQSEIIKAKRNVEISEERFRKSQEVGHIGSWEFNLITNEFWGSDEGKRIYNLDLDKKEFSAEEVMTLVAENDREKVNQAMIDLVNENKPYDIIFEITPKDTSEKKIINSIAEVQRDEDGNPLKVTGILHDITLQKNTEKKLLEAKEKAEESEAKYRALYQNAPLAYQSLNINGEIKDINPQWLKTLGYKREEVIGEWFGNFLTSDYQEHFRRNFKQFKKKGTVSGVEFNMVRSDDAEITVSFEGCIGYDDKGNFKQTYCTFKDITQQKEAELELIKAKEKAEESERKLLEAQKISHVGSWEYIVDTDTVTWSKELYNIFERSHDLPAPNFSEQRPYYTEESFAVLDKAVQDCVQREIPYTTELDIYTSTGSIKHIISKGNVKKDDSNKIIGCVGTAQDITVQKKLESDIIKAKEKAEEADRLKSAFLANMSHEIRTPMNGILGFTNLLKDPEFSGKEHQKFIDIIEKSGDRMLSTINDIIDISKIESGQVDVTISDINLNRQIDAHFEFFLPETTKKNIKLSITNKVPDQKANIKSDKEKLDSILTNIIKNAIKYTHAGSIEFGCSINERSEQDEITFYVKDTGIGISKGRQKAVFDRFVQADIDDKQVYEGSGLGLAISQAYVEMLGGKIWVESEEGVGSQFYFTIPYKTNKKEIPEKNTADLNHPQSIEKDLKILIAEDDETAITYLNIVLNEYAKEMLVAKTGTEAVELCRDHPDIDLVLMDIKMPGINGYDATQQIRNFNKEVFIMAQTAYAQSDDREKAIEAGCDEYISKPINKEKLLEIIANRF